MASPRRGVRGPAAERGAPGMGGRRRGTEEAMVGGREEEGSCGRGSVSMAGKVGVTFVVEDCIGVVCDALLSRSCLGCAEEAWTNCVDGRSLEALSPVQGLGIWAEWKLGRRRQDSSGSKASCPPSKCCLWSKTSHPAAASRCNQSIDIPIE